MGRLFTAGVIVAAGVLLGLADGAFGQDPATDKCLAWSLGTDADIDQGKLPHFTPPERIGKAGQDGEVSFRSVIPTFQVMLILPAFDFDAENHGTINHPFYLTVKFKDVARKAVTVAAGKGGCGFYGAGWVGTFGGAGDGQWKEETLVIPRSMMRCTDGKTFLLKFTEPRVEVPVASLTLFSGDSKTPGMKEKAAAAEKTLAEKREATRKRLLPQFRNLGLPDPGPCPEYTAAEKARGFRVFFPPISRQLFANSQPQEGELTKDIKLYACPGQTVSLVVAVRALQDAGIVSVSPNWPKTNPPSVMVLPTRWAVYSEQRIGSSWGKDYRVCPERLVVKDGQDVKSDRLEIAVVTLKVADTAKAGSASGSVTIWSMGKQVVIPVALTVYPFTMERPAHSTHGQFYYIDYGDYDPFELADMADHGMDMVVAGLCPSIYPGPDGKYDQTERVRKAWAALKKFGYRAPIMCGNGSMAAWLKDENNRKKYDELIAMTLKMAKDEGFDEMGFFPVDEPHTPDLQQLALKACTWIKDTPGANTFITSNPKAVPVLDEVLNYVCYNLTYLNEKTIRSMKPHQKLMFYCPSIDVNPEYNRYRPGYYMFRIDAHSSQYFAYMEFKEDPFCDLDGDTRDWNTVYPSMTSPTHDPTLEWEAMREGVYDYRYLWTLSAVIARAKAKGKAAEAAKAQKVLDGVLAMVDVDGKKAGGPAIGIEADTRLKDRKLDPKQLAEVKALLGASWYDASRRKIADVIISLKRAIGE